MTTSRQRLDEFTLEQADFIRRKGRELGELRCSGMELSSVKDGVCPVCGRHFESGRSVATCGDPVCRRTILYARIYVTNRVKHQDKRGTERVNYAAFSVSDDAFVAKSGDGYCYNADPVLGF